MYMRLCRPPQKINRCTLQWAPCNTHLPSELKVTVNRGQSLLCLAASYICHAVARCLVAPTCIYARTHAAHTGTALHKYNEHRSKSKHIYDA